MEAKKDKIWALKSMLEADVCCIKIHHEILWHLNRQMHSSLPSPWCWKPERNRESRRKQTSSAVLLAASASLAEVQTGSCLQTRHPHRGQESTSRSFNMPGTARSLKTPENSWMLLIHLDTSWYILIPWDTIHTAVTTPIWRASIAPKSRGRSPGLEAESAVEPLTRRQGSTYRKKYCIKYNTWKYQVR